MSARKRSLPTTNPLKSTSEKRQNVGNQQGLTWSHNSVHLVLTDRQEAIFSGSGTLKVESGQLHICGKIVSPDHHPLTIKTTDFAPITLAVAHSNAQIPLSSQQGEVQCTISSLVDIPLAIPPPKEDTTTNNTVGFKISIKNQGNTQNPSPLTIADDWQVALDEITASISSAPAGTPSPILLLAGPKKVGKSTLGRLVVNTLLNSHSTVAYLDTDCGQPEFTPPGLVSLSLLTDPVLGPPHLHTRQPEASHFIGELSPAGDPGVYLGSIQSLYQWYLDTIVSTKKSKPASRKNQKNTSVKEVVVPLVINTHGWVKGLGFDVLVELLNMVPVTHFLNLASLSVGKNLPSGGFWLEAGSQVPLPLMWQLSGLKEYTLGTHGNQGQQQQAVSAVDSRTLQWIAFAEDCIKNMGQSNKPALNSVSQDDDTKNINSAAATADVGDYLAGLVPFQAPLASFKQVQFLYGQVPSTQTLRALCGSIVGLCRAPADGDAPGRPPMCLGLGIIRSVKPPPSFENNKEQRLQENDDSLGGEIYILTPVEESKLEDVSILQVGKLELPKELLQTGRYMSPYLTLFAMSASGTGAGVIKSRGNLVRLGQL